LTEIGHPDHTLISYPGLGHYFYPEDYWSIAMGPMQNYVLQDLEAWLKDPARKVRSLYSQLQTAENTIEKLQGQLGDLEVGLEGRTDQLEDQLEQLESELTTLKLGDLEVGLEGRTDQLEDQLEQLESELTTLKETIAELETRDDELQSALDSSRNITYIALGAAIIAVAIMLFQRRTA
jgi:chromosome segregation ATPase